MAEVNVTEIPEESEDESAHGAAVSEGAAEVHRERAAEAAAEAAMAAEVAANAAMANASIAGEAHDAAASAGESASVAQSSADAVVAAVNAQTEMLRSLVERLDESRAAQTPPPVTKPAKKTTDKPPAPSRKRGSWYYGR